MENNEEICWIERKKHISIQKTRNIKIKKQKAQNVCQKKKTCKKYLDIARSEKKIIYLEKYGINVDSLKEYKK